MLRVSIVFMFLMIVAGYFCFGTAEEGHHSLTLAHLLFFCFLAACLLTAIIGGLNRRAWGSP